MTHVEFKKGQTETPNVRRKTVIVAARCFRVEPFGTHVGARANIGLAGFERAAHEFADSEVCNLDFALGVYEDVRRFDVAVCDVARVEAREALEDVTRHRGESLLGERAAGGEGSFEGAAVHVLHDDGHVAGGLFEAAVEADDVGAVGGEAEDGALCERAAARGGVGVAVDDFERVGGGGGLVADLVDCAAVAVAEHGEVLEVGGGLRTPGGEGGDWGGGGGGLEPSRWLVEEKVNTCKKRSKVKSEWCEAFIANE